MKSASDKSKTKMHRKSNPQEANRKKLEFEIGASVTAFDDSNDTSLFKFELNHCSSSFPIMLNHLPQAPFASSLSTFVFVFTAPMFCPFSPPDGGLAPESRFSGHKAVFSGPAGGVVGYSQTLFGLEMEKPLIGFDMGGTSTDVSRYAGSYEQVLETKIAGAKIAGAVIQVLQ